MENVNSLSGLGAAVSVAIGSSSASVALPSGTKSISVVAVGSACSVKLGNSTVSAATSDHYLSSGERRDLLVRNGETHIAVIREGAGSGTLRVSALVNGYTVEKEIENTNYGVPFNVSAPAISGDTSVGATLTATSGVWNGSTPMTFSYQWLANDVVIPDATATTFSNTLDTVTYKVRVSARNARGEADAVTSAGTTISGGGPE